MATKTSIAQIKSTLLKPSLTSFFEVTIGIPNGLRSWLGTPRQENLNLLCSEVDLPGSSVATTEMTNDFTGVTERHAYRRIFEESTNFTFYVDAGQYTSIRFFERWLEYITNGVDDGNAGDDLTSQNYSYRMRYPDGNDGYTASGLTVKKFERDMGEMYQGIEYDFIKSFPLAITSMPVSYGGSDLLKCTVSMTYIRYIFKHEGQYKWPSLAESSSTVNGGTIFDRTGQSRFNIGGLAGLAAQFTGADATLGMNDQLRSIQSGLA
tara:strand:- start:836 stop:1630 length:795 start_codon:yes stop_codon:yes gene_type:complete